MNVPQHIAIIMDGNGRWALARGKERGEGHAAGVRALHDTLRNAADLGVRYLTVYAFSTENWNRPQGEVDALMALFAESITQYTSELVESGVKLRFIGDLSRLGADHKAHLLQAVASTAECDTITLIVALSYSARWELNKAFVNGLEACRDKQLNPYDNPIEPFLETAGIPDPDLLIRTGGEQRISNFLLYQMAYTELYFTSTLWPDFSKADLEAAIKDFNSRERRYGALPDTDTTP